MSEARERDGSSADEGSFRKKKTGAAEQESRERVRVRWRAARHVVSMLGYLRTKITPADLLTTMRRHALLWHRAATTIQAAERGRLVRHSLGHGHGHGWPLTIGQALNSWRWRPHRTKPSRWDAMARADADAVEGAVL